MTSRLLGGVLRSQTLVPRLEALLAAVLFGASTPLSKLLLATVDPLVLAGLSYVGAGLAAGVVVAVRRRDAAAPDACGLVFGECLALAGAVVAGGVAAPILMMYGLSATPAGTASLLLNLEAVATTLIASLVFREAIGRRIWVAVVLITVASCLLAWRAGSARGLSWGAAGVIGACVLWGIDNNLTRLVSGSDAIKIVLVKGGSAGAMSLVLAAVMGAERPGLRAAMLAIALGSISFGASIALFVRALRSLGAARTGGLFGIAPFVGAWLSWVWLAESPSRMVLTSLPLMAVGAFLLLTESHRHLHRHAALEHEHSHTHDDGHHDHGHEGIEVLPGVRHTHRHRHAAVTHDHPHAPDLHHRHRHGQR